jgi:hypothetical protein
VRTLTKAAGKRAAIREEIEKLIKYAITSFGSTAYP